MGIASKLRFPHPGIILKEEFLEPMGVTQYRLAVDTGMPPSRVTALVKGKVGITADTAIRLARFFGTDAQSWLNLQNRHDLRNAEAEKHKDYEKIHKCVAA